LVAEKQMGSSAAILAGDVLRSVAEVMRSLQESPHS
jgi:hypothetical protein